MDQTVFVSLAALAAVLALVNLSLSTEPWLRTAASSRRKLSAEVTSSAVCAVVCLAAVTAGPANLPADTLLALAVLVDVVVLYRCHRAARSRNQQQASA